MVLHEGGRVRMGTSDRVRGEGSICWASVSSSEGNMLVEGYVGGGVDVDVE
jgi:hypothetical protein